MKVAAVSILLAAVCWSSSALKVTQFSTYPAQFQPVSLDRLQELERHFAGEGGYSAKTKVRQEWGGDRMDPNAHNYGPTYENYLSKLFPVHTHLPTIVEVGILKGTGLAMWASLFPNSPIYGFDIDPSVYLDNRVHLKSLGFNETNVQVQTMDQLNDNTQLILEKLAGRKASIVVDDGLHTPKAANNTFNSMLPSLADKFVYFIEDINVDWSSEAVDKMHEYLLQTCHKCGIQVSEPLGLKQERMIIIYRV